jgi:UDP-GlcNAc3NAcA epimerase
MTTTVALFAGIRPHFIKASVLRGAIPEDGRLRLVMVNAGQHYSPELMGDSVMGPMTFDFELAVKPDRGEIQPQIRREAEILLAELRQVVDWCVVMGDAACSVSVARAARAAAVPIANMEAGIRGPNEGPESANAVEIDGLSALRLAASTRALENLTSEGYRTSVFAGDVYLDFVLAEQRSIGGRDPLESAVPYVLISGHHLTTASLYRCLIEETAIACRGLGLRAVAIAHPKFGPMDVELAEMIAPLRHIDLLGAIDHASFVVTDSGGMQREAYYLGKRCVLLQDRAWWPELVDAGAHMIVGSSPANIAHGVGWAAAAAPFVPDLEQFGGGYACRRIVEALST